MEAAMRTNVALTPQADTSTWPQLQERRPCMGKAIRYALMGWMVLLAAVSFGGLVWMWPVAATLNGKEVSAKQAVAWFGPHFTATAMTSLIIVVAFAAVAGSVVHLIMVFTLRAGKGTLECGYESWYLLRPVAAALLGVVLFLAVHAGVMTIGESGAPNVPLYGLAGALAGLFTDRVLQRLRAVLGATDPNTPASEQEIPA
jgi:hypothetical protein